MLYLNCKGGVVMNKDILIDVTLEQLKKLSEKVQDLYVDLNATRKTLEHFHKEVEEDTDNEETTIEDEIMSALKDIIDEKSFKNVNVKVVKVDEKDE